MSSLNLTGVLRTHREEILRVLSPNGLSNPRIFGSAARWEDRPESDIDLLVDIEQRRSLLDLIAAKQGLEDNAWKNSGPRNGTLTESLHSEIGDRGSRSALKRDRVYLLHIRDGAALIAEYTRAHRF